MNDRGLRIQKRLHRLPFLDRLDAPTFTILEMNGESYRIEPETVTETV